MRSAGHVQIRYCFAERQTCGIRPDLRRSGTALEVRRGQVRTLPDQSRVLLSGRAGLQVLKSFWIAGGAAMKPKVAFFDFARILKFIFQNHVRFYTPQYRVYEGTNENKR